MANKAPHRRSDVAPRRNHTDNRFTVKKANVLNNQTHDLTNNI